MTFDKPRLIDDLLRGATINYSSPDIAGFDRVIDATGVSRAYLPSIKDDIVVPCIQFRVHNSNHNGVENRIKFGGIGYAWYFPLLDNESHIGAQSLRVEPDEVLRKTEWGLNKENKTMCGCVSKIRLTSPFGSYPFVSGNIWGIGESIGCVGPIACDGIIPGMKSVQILLKYWNDADKYTSAIFKEFSWMSKERVLIDKLRDGKPLNLKDGWVLKKNSERMGMEMGLTDALKILWKLR